ncbi:MAG: 30S ribosomal protein S3 [Candidatus Staskawiczbacteria bacterium RIFCSPHIGHO2_02_FULL_43_16]|uniref:Small ribosomal subunit protein uS3 n=1 Tax=Candidatus Staskawiczbacteria bacterium RIFCSPHIGHO2_01_FULL_41_41 TaxID=1802203 RepID=A0A1G2HSM8_9BACT|nr:MAG: 30S ribosomal protein S3 [Candidatus Staskawiczbacteria bacterium RIFCSPHIGHO2_01_FULL_41_41]OGZ68261.1 MAG: 30S ribosomal protein S3 [Candidatus Staskawiczbacteria bacterium RIFCSPHIGHO2_02_FULL_43_16]OGZ74650.1 MAG: 30S ribosomal protein S3 [Candidatus Staskawiczbacteria bacterium RIFCSPLOWO2_01_FULL_43_17b]
MTHKVHPKAFRIKGMEDFNIRGFYGKKMPSYLQQDFLVKDFLYKTLKESSVANIQIEHSANKLNIIIESARPGLIIGRGGEGAEVLKKQIEKILLGAFLTKAPKGKTAAKAAARQIKIDIKEIKNPWTSAALVAQMAAQQLEKRIPFRQALKRNMERAMQNKEVKGIKMNVSGRLNGNEIARDEWLKQGRMPLGTIRADIDYALAEAHCTYGIIGVKVWIYKGDKFN